MIKEQLETSLLKIEEIQALYEKELRAAPPGRLLVSKSHDTIRYYQSLHENEKYVKRGIGKQPELIQRLARKIFLEKALTALKANAAALRRVLKSYRPFDPKHVASSLSASLQFLPEEYFHQPLIDQALVQLDQSTQQRIQSHLEWGKADFSQSTHLVEARAVITSKGERMRSRGEALIAERLYAYGIPFRYEQELILPDGRLAVPDFTFEGANGEEFYLEFCGMMDDTNYVARHCRKMAAYQNAGIVPWKNIIYLYAFGNEMNLRHIDHVIEDQIIPWL